MLYKIKDKNGEISHFQLMYHTDICLSCNTRDDWEFFVWREFDDSLAKDLQDFFDRDDVVFTSWVDGLWYLPTWEMVEGYSRKRVATNINKYTNTNKSGKFSRVLNFFKRS